MADLFTASDMARAHRTVLDAGRRADGARIRDTDGTELLLAPAAEVQRDRYMRDGYRDAAHLLVDLLRAEGEVAIKAPGNFAWVDVLPSDDRRQFVAEYVHALDRVAPVGEDAVERVIYDWQQTARAWADDDVRAGLRGDLREPLNDIKL